jgi:manganese transport protein
LNGALFVNAAILIVAASVFFQRGIAVNEIQQAHLLLAPLLGTTLASILFAVALLCAGQSSTLTGTMAGQIVMEGFLNFRMRPWLRRLITRLVAIIPAAITIVLAGEQATYKLLIFSQVILSMQLPFAVIPLIHFTSSRKRMGEFASGRTIRVVAWTVATIIVGLNIRLVWGTVGDWLEIAGPWRPYLLAGIVLTAAGLLLLLAWVSLEPLLPKLLSQRGDRSWRTPSVPIDLAQPTYKRILVPLDHSERDEAALRHAASMAKTHGATLFLLHVEEDVTSQVYGSLASTAEVEAGRGYLQKIAETLRRDGIEVEAVVRHSPTPRTEIVHAARELKPDLLIMGAHGHKGIKDLVFGATINGVRHDLELPILIVRDRRQ